MKLRPRLHPGMLQYQISQWVVESAVTLVTLTAVVEEVVEEAVVKASGRYATMQRGMNDLAGDIISPFVLPFNTITFIGWCLL